MNTGISAFQSMMLQPEAVLHSKGVFENPNGPTQTIAGRGHNGLVAFSKNAIKDEETLERVVGFFDRLADEEMCNLLALGVEGEQYTVADGVAHMLDEGDAAYLEKIYNPYTAPLAVRWPNLRTMPVDYNYGDARTLEILEENEPYAVADPTLGLISELNNEIGGDLGTLLSDAKTLYVMGEIDKDEYMNRLEMWKNQGGDDVAKEFAALYEARIN